MGEKVPTIACAATAPRGPCNTYNLPATRTIYIQQAYKPYNVRTLLIQHVLTPQNAYVYTYAYGCVHTRIQPKRTPTTPHCPLTGFSLEFSLPTTPHCPYTTHTVCHGILPARTWTCSKSASTSSSFRRGTSSRSAPTTTSSGRSFGIDSTSSPQTRRTSSAAR